MITARDEFAWLIRQLALATKTELTAEQAEIYYRQVRGYPRSVLLMAVDYLIKTLRFFPAPAELVEAAERFNGERITARDAARRQTGDWDGADFDAAFNDASAWRLYVTGRGSVNDLTDADIEAIYADLQKHHILGEEGLGWLKHSERALLGSTTTGSGAT